MTSIIHTIMPAMTIDTVARSLIRLIVNSGRLWQLTWDVSPGAFARIAE